MCGHRSTLLVLSALVLTSSLPAHTRADDGNGAPTGFIYSFLGWRDAHGDLQWSIGRLSADGAQFTTLPPPPPVRRGENWNISRLSQSNGYRWTVTPDGRYIVAILVEGGTWRLPTDGSPPTLVSEIGGGVFLRSLCHPIEPIGFVGYRKEDGDYTIRLYDFEANREVVPVVETPYQMVPAYEPWSADGSRALLVCRGEGREKLCPGLPHPNYVVVPTMGGDPICCNIQTEAHETYHPCLSPDGSQVAFTDTNGALWLYGVADGLETKVADPPPGYEWETPRCRGGRLTAVTTPQIGTRGNARIGSWDWATLEGSWGPPITGGGYCWDPSGEWLLLLTASKHNMGSSLWTVKWDGSEQTNISEAWEARGFRFEHEPLLWGRAPH